MDRKGKSGGEAQDAAFQRVIGYFLDHEKPKNEPVKRGGKRIKKARKRPSTKAKKRA